MIILFIDFHGFGMKPNILCIYTIMIILVFRDYVTYVYIFFVLVCLNLLNITMDGKRSKLWTFFSKESDNKAKCDLCLSLYSVKGGSTANLKKHLMSKHRASYDSLFQSAESEPRNDGPEPGPSTSRDIQEVQQSTQPLEEKAQESTKKKVNPVQTSLTMFTKKPMNIARKKKLMI